MTQNLFKWKHFQTEIIILCVRWYLKYPLSYRMLVEIMQEVTQKTFLHQNHKSYNSFMEF